VAETGGRFEMNPTDLDNIEAAALGRTRLGRFAHPDDTLLLVAEIRRLYAGQPHPGHVFAAGIIAGCIRCGDAYRGQPSAVLPCDPSKLAGKTEFCCECGQDYPRADLIAGEVFCPNCRANKGNL
jgi:hypothetical protein